MNFETLKKKDKKYLLNNYAKFDVAIVKGQGATLYDYDGKEYIDFGSGIGVNSFGANDLVWKKAIISQIKKIQHTCNLYYNEPQVKLASLLSKKTGCKKVFFCNSGAEANEGAIKCARKYSFDKYGENRYEIITLKNSFHGRTMATLSATGQEEMHKYFSPFSEGFVYVKANDIENFYKSVTKKTCAVMLEIIQGESGVINLDEEYITKVAEYCKLKDILLIIDEVQTGNGRTGKLYSYMNYNLSPDIVTTAKGLAGGMPIGAVLFFKKTENTLSTGTHGSTFGGNPVCAAAAYSVLKRLDDFFLEEVKQKSDYIKNALLSMKKVKSVTGMGLMLGIETDLDAKEAAKSLIGKGLLVLTAKNKIRLLPPLNITKEEIDIGLSKLKEVLD